MKPLRLLTTTIVASFALALTALAGDPTGTWKFQMQGPKGGTSESTLILAWTNNQLTGTIDNRAGKAEIRDAAFANDQVTFTVVREFKRRLRSFTLQTHYQGRLEGDTIKGTIETTGRDKKPVSLPWEAQRAK